MSTNSDTPDDSKAPNYENEEVAQELRATQQERTQQREAQREKHLSIKEQLQRQQREQTFEVEVGRVDVEFRDMGGEDIKRAMNAVERLETMEAGDPVGDVIGEFIDVAGELLGRYSVDDELDAAFWPQSYGPEQLMDILDSVMYRGRDAGEIEQFRDE